MRSTARESQSRDSRPPVLWCGRTGYGFGTQQRAGWVMERGWGMMVVVVLKRNPTTFDFPRQSSPAPARTTNIYFYIISLFVYAANGLAVYEHISARTSHHVRARFSQSMLCAGGVCVCAVWHTAGRRRTHVNTHTFE